MTPSRQRSLLGRAASGIVLRPQLVDNQKIIDRLVQISEFSSFAPLPPATSVAWLEQLLASLAGTFENVQPPRGFDNVDGCRSRYPI